MSKWIKGLRKQKGPREIEPIKQEYSQLLARSGELQYQVYVYSKDLDQVNKRMLEVNNEASERIKLDKEAEANKPKEQ